MLAQNQLINRIPEVQTREMESVLRVQSGGVAILGGLMQDSRNNNSDEVPGLNRLPVFGNLFKYRDEGSKKTELVIFLRPTVLIDPTLDGDLKEFRSTLQEAREDDDLALARRARIKIDDGVLVLGLHAQLAQQVAKLFPARRRLEVVDDLHRDPLFGDQLVRCATLRAAIVVIDPQRHLAHPTSSGR